MSTDTKDLVSDRVHLFQFNPDNAARLFEDYEAGEELWWVNMDRRHDSLADDDLVVFWVSGPADKAGVVGMGAATGDVEERQMPVDFADPDGPTRLRPSACIALFWVTDEPVVTREQLKQDKAFDDFELFAMPNRPNAFNVTRPQAEIIIEHIRAVTD